MKRGENRPSEWMKPQCEHQRAFLCTCKVFGISLCIGLETCVVTRDDLCIFLGIGCLLICFLGVWKVEGPGRSDCRFPRSRESFSWGGSEIEVILKGCFGVIGLG